MNFRITTNMMMNTYRYNLQNATRTRDLSSTKVQTRRNFNSFAEDPAAATHAWRLRRSYSKNVDYQNSNTEIQASSLTVLPAAPACGIFAGTLGDAQLGSGTCTPPAETLTPR